MVCGVQRPAAARRPAAPPILIYVLVNRLNATAIRICLSAQLYAKGWRFKQTTHNVAAIMENLRCIIYMFLHILF